MAKQIDWTHFDTLLRELGRLRAAVEARTIPEGTVPELRAHIDRAADAVRRLIDSPDDDELIVSAWELIVVTQTLMARGEQPTPARPQPTPKELRQRAIDAMSRAATNRGRSREA